MEPMTMMAIGAVAAPIVGGLVGNALGAKDRKQARALMAQALAQLQAVGMPPDMSKELIFKEFEKAGIYSPELEEDINVASSEFGKIQEAPELRDAQMKALAGIQRRGEVGLTAEERAGLGEITNRLAKEAEAKREQILQGMQQRGTAGSGAELAAQLASAQESTNLASQQGQQLAGMASTRALESLRQAGSLGGDIRAQDYGVASDKARAMDELNQFIARNSIERQRQNVAAKNTAQQRNLGEKQRLMDVNTQMANQEKLRQADAQRQYWADRLGYAQAQANALTGQAQSQLANAQSKGQMGATIGSGVGTGLGMAAMYGGSSPSGTTNRADLPQDTTLDTRSNFNTDTYRTG